MHCYDYGSMAYCCRAISKRDTTVDWSPRRIARQRWPFRAAGGAVNTVGNVGCRLCVCAAAARLSDVTLPPVSGCGPAAACMAGNPGSAPDAANAPMLSRFMLALASDVISTPGVPLPALRA